MKKFLWAIGGAVLALGALACGTGSDVGQRDTSPPEVVVNHPSHSPAVKVTKIGRAQIADGAWRVGQDVQPGQYRAVGAADSLFSFCTWSLKHGETIKDFGSTQKGSDPQLVDLASGDRFETSGCTAWVKQ